VEASPRQGMTQLVTYTRSSECVPMSAKAKAYDIHVAKALRALRFPIARLSAEYQPAQGASNEGWNVAKLAPLLFLVSLSFQPNALAQVKEARRTLVLSELRPRSPGVPGIGRELLGALEKAPYYVEFYSKDAMAEPPNVPVLAVDDVPVSSGTQGSDKFNFAVRGRAAAAMAERALPPGGTMLKRVPNFWQEYKRYIVAGTFLILIQTLIIIALLWQRAKRRRVEAELVRSSNQLRLAMESGKTVGWDLDVKTGRDTWFGDLPTMFGMKSETFIGQVSDFYSYVHPDDRKRVSDAVAAARQERQPYAAEFRILWPDGTVRWIVARGKFEYARNGEPKRMLGMAVDITERKQTEEALKKSEEKFSQAFRESPLALTLISTNDHRYIEVNETFERMTGWGRDEVIGRTPFDLEIWVDPSQRIELTKQLLLEAPVRNVELRFRARDGKPRTGLASAELIEVHGEPCALWVVTDITDLQQAEEARQLSERRFSQFFETLPEYCYIASPGGEVLDANTAACSAMGYTRPELLGKPLSDIYASECALKLVHLLEECKSTGTLRNEEMVIITKEGNRRTVLLNAGAVKDAEGNILYFASVLVDISELKKIQKQLHENRERLEGIVASAMDAIIAIDEEQRIIVFNNAAEKMFRCPARDAIGTSINRFLPQRFCAAQQGHDWHFDATGVTSRSARGALFGLRATGEEFPIEASISQLETGGKKLFTAIVRDITEREQADFAQRRLAAIVQSSDDAIVSTNLDGVIVSWNRGAQRIYGYSEAEALGQSLRMIAPAELHTEEDSILQRVKAGESIEHYETVRLTKHRERIHVSLSISPVRDAAGNIVGTSKIARDMTERKRAQDSLRESEERFRLVANTAPVLIWMSGVDKLCTYFNWPWLEFRGRTLEQELGNGWAEGVHPADLEGCLKTYGSAFDLREPFEMEYRLRRHDGEYRWIFDRGVPRFNPDRSFAGYVGSCIDVTDRKRAQEALSGMSGKLIEAQEQERRWIARELHDDINQRIALVAVHLEHLQEDHSALDSGARQRLQGIRELIANLGSDVQALSHHLHSSKLEYLGLVAATKSFCKELSEKYVLEIEVDSEGVPQSLPQDVALALFRVLQEGLKNAVKYSGSRHFEVKLSGTPGGVELSVRDAGIGFEPEEEAMKGAGLGLTSMQERLKLVHGELSIESRLGQGTLIRATVPLIAIAGAKAAQA